MRLASGVALAFGLVTIVSAQAQAPTPSPAQAERATGDSFCAHQKTTQIDKARALSLQAAIYVDGLRTEVAAMARTLELETGSTSFAARLARIAEQKALSRYIEGSRLVYLSVVALTGTGPGAGLDISGDARLQKQLAEAFQEGQHRRAVLSVPIVCESLQEPVVVLGEPVLVGTHVEAVVLAVASLEPIREITKGTGGGVFEVYVIDNRGRLIAHSDPNRPLAEDMSGIEIVRIFLQQPAQEPVTPDASGRRSRRGGFGTTLFEMKGSDGVAHQMLGTYMPVPDSSGWGVIVQIEEPIGDSLGTRRSAVPVSDDYDAAVRQLIEVMSIGYNGGKLIDQVVEMFKKRLPDVPAAVWDDLRTQIAMEEVASLQVAILKKHFSLDEVRGLLAFFRSPVGQRYLQEQPGLMEDGMALGEEFGRKAAERLPRCLQQKGYTLG